MSLVVAPNPSPLTLEGTNTWIVDGWVVDPGPAQPGHLAAVAAAAGSAEGIVLTHSHLDHTEGAEQLASALGGVEVVAPADGDSVGPLSVIGTPGHSADSVCLLWKRVLFTGDTVLGAGSVFIAPGEGSLSAYLESLERLLALDLEAICPGHGPVVHDPHLKLREYRDHRLERESRVIAALDAGARTRADLLAHAWSDVDLAAAPLLEVAAAATLAAHLQKLADDGSLPAGVDPDAVEGPPFGDS
ncbi:MAG TPA: MBL fold metallo-hydrolase [Thermoleophilaceae bacterium]|nr:MBL fold metallo-hydrolase [Thermoleophilaceae bacterium]